jgi:hypothetical protein
MIKRYDQLLHTYYAMVDWPKTKKTHWVPFNIFYFGPLDNIVYAWPCCCSFSYINVVNYHSRLLVFFTYTSKMDLVVFNWETWISNSCLCVLASITLFYDSHNKRKELSHKKPQLITLMWSKLCGFIHHNVQHVVLFSHTVHNNSNLTLSNGTYVGKPLPSVNLQLLGIVCHNKHRVFYIIMDESS